MKNTKNGGDRRVVLCDLGEKSIKIGINTAGDDGEMVMQSMTLFDDYGCNIVICTTKASIRTDEGSIATMQREIIKRQDVIQVIPIFKIMFKKHDHALNDEFMKEVIINQLMQFI